MKKLFITLVTAVTITSTAGCMSSAAGTAASMALPYAQSLLTPQSSPTNLAPMMQSSDLIGTLVQQLGVTPQQAAGGAGSIFSVAQQRMNPTDFTQLSQSIPNMNQYLSAAPQSAMPNGMANNPLANLGALAGAFQGVGLNADMASKFLPIVLQYVQSQGGASMMGLLQSALLP